MNPNTSSPKAELQSLRPKGFPGLPEGWVSTWETFPSADGNARLFSAVLHREDWPTPRALFVFHGIGEHGGRYSHFPHYLKDTLSAVAWLDHRGHGRSDGLRGHVETFDQLADDGAVAIRRLDEVLKKRFGKSEIHVFGHSLGGIIAYRTLLLHPDLPVASLSLSAPLFRVKQRVPLPKKMAAGMLSKIWGTLQLSTGIDAANLSQDPEVVKAYQQDRLVHDKMTPLFFTQMQDALNDSWTREPKLQIPVQFILPMKDAIVDAAASIEFFERIQAPAKQLVKYDDFLHESFNEPQKERAFKDLASWISSLRFTPGAT